MIDPIQGSWQMFVGMMLLVANATGRSGCAAIRIINAMDNGSAEPRSLIFPPTAPTRVQFIGGIGIPVEDLHFESVTSGYVLKAEYFLPTRADEFRQKIKPQSIHRRRRSNNDTDDHMRRVVFTDEPFINNEMNDSQNNATTNEDPSFAHKYTRDQMAREKWRDNQQAHHAGCYRWIIYKAIELVLNNSRQSGRACLMRSICEHAKMPFGNESGLLAELLHILLTPSTSQDDLLNSVNWEYLDAEALGHSGISCSSVFKECVKSPLEIISTVLDTNTFQYINKHK